MVGTGIVGVRYDLMEPAILTVFIGLVYFLHARPVLVVKIYFGNLCDWRESIDQRQVAGL